MEVAKPSMCVDVRGGTQVVVYGATSPSSADWAHYLDHCRRRGFKNVLMVAHPECPGPDSAQRKALNALWSAVGQPKIAFVTISKVQRMVVAAFNLFQDESVRAFSPLQLPEAFAYVELPSLYHSDVVATIHSMADRLRAVRLKHLVLMPGIQGRRSALESTPEA